MLDGFRMRNTLAALAVVATCAVAAAGTERDRAKTAAGGVKEQLGTSDKLNQNAMEPMSTDKPMTTVDGTSFDAQVSCPGSMKFLRLTLLPNSSGDIGQFGADLDTDFDGSLDSSRLFTGPYAAVCTNGMVQCAAGSTSPCTYWRWKASASSVELSNLDESGNPMTQSDLGACYCINNSCGSNLLMINSGKILNDMGVGYARALQSTYPRMSVAKAVQVDAMTQEFYGQQTGCGSDNEPEKYYKNPSSLSGDGADYAKTDPKYSMLMSSPAAAASGTEQSSCEVNRRFTYREIKAEDIINLVSRTAGTTTPCGSTCMRYGLGRPGTDDFYDGGKCVVFTEKQVFQVNYPDRVTSAHFTFGSWDDEFQVAINGTTVWTSVPGWSGPGDPRGSCENKRNFTASPNTDITSFFRSNSVVEHVNYTAVGGGGDGYGELTINVNPGCEVASESIDNMCSTREDNADCRLKEEWVDGVQTVANYYSTGLYPLPSSRPLGDGGSCNAGTAERPFWQKKRTYVCKTGDQPYDGEDAKKRYQSIHSSFDPDTGTYTDQQKKNGSWSSSAASITLPPKDEVPGCRMMCKTRKPRPGTAMVEGGATSRLNNTGPAWDYTYRECSEASVCPAAGDEEIVSPCDCSSNFNEAATMMQNIRMVGQDLICTSQPN